MSMTWLAVLNQSNMKIFARDTKNRPLELIKTIPNLLVSLKGDELSRHKPGTRPKGGRGSRVSVMNSGENPHDMIVVDFAHKIGKYLNASRKKNQFKELKIAAEPRFLGLIKSELDPETTKCVRAWVAKDLQNEKVTRITALFDRQ
jgi:protein required for attachment to host cells